MKFTVTYVVLPAFVDWDRVDAVSLSTGNAFAVVDLNTELKETTTETNATVQELKTELAIVKNQLGDQQKMMTSMYRH